MNFPSATSISLSCTVFNFPSAGNDPGRSKVQGFLQNFEFEFGYDFEFGFDFELECDFDFQMLASLFLNLRCRKSHLPNPVSASAFGKWGLSQGQTHLPGALVLASGPVKWKAIFLASGPVK